MSTGVALLIATFVAAMVAILYFYFGRLEKRRENRE